MAPESTIVVHNVAELHAAEGRIVERLAKARHGQELFLLDPIAALNDVGVRLSPPLEEELRQRFQLPRTGGAAYRLIKKGEASPPMSVKLRRLFEYES